MGHFGRITSLDDLPPATTISAYVRKATSRIDEKATPGRAAPRAGRRRTRA